ncbi:glycosyltransferase family 2 protein [Verrucomicrobiota bacterium]
MTNPLVSCIVPAFNAERFLGEAVDSILGQTYRPIEVIVVDDGSTDRTADVASGYGDQIVYVRQLNAGPAAARNEGLTRAKGAYVAFLDADDLWHPEKLSRQMAAFNACPDLELCCAHLEHFWVPELQSEKERFEGHRLRAPAPAYSLATLLARRSAFDRVGLLNGELQHADGMEWFLRAAEQGAVQEMLPDVLLRRRLHQDNRSRRRAAASRHAHLQVIKASLDRRRGGSSQA